MKRAWKSKINWMGLALALFGLALDPEFQKHLGSIVPQELVGKIVSVSGMLLMVLRTCCTSQSIGKGEGSA